MVKAIVSLGFALAALAGQADSRNLRTLGPQYGSGGGGARCSDHAIKGTVTVADALCGSAWTAESDQDLAYYGWSVTRAGDVNGDGYDDVIVGAPKYDIGQADEGRAFVYLGSASGLSTSTAWMGEGDQSSAGFGSSVASAGDVNGDGYCDVIIGAPGYDSGEADEGRAFVYLGSASGLATSPSWTAESNQVDARFGRAVSTAGDVNGDGHSDVIVAAYQYSNGESQEGRAFVYLGSAAGLEAAASWTGESDQAYSWFGVSVGTAGDVNGDGYGDVIAGAHGYANGQPYEGRAFVYLGSAGGLATSPSWTAESDQAYAIFGYSVSGAGDVNGDGYSDVIVAAPQFDNGQPYEGSAFVYLGSASGLATSAAWTAESNQDYAGFDWSVASAGNVNGDGYSDVIIGAPRYDNGQADEGRAFVFLGSTDGLATSEAWAAESDQQNASFGSSVATAGDIDGDGYSDVIVGAHQFSNGQSQEGRAFVYLGDGCGGLGTKYCTANANSTGAPADISASGSSSWSDGNLLLDAAPVPNQFGIFFHGMNESQVSFGNGFLCTTGDLVRGAVIQGSSNLASYTYDSSDVEHDLFPFIGTQRNFQYWFRDPMGGGALFNTSNAISIAILP